MGRYREFDERFDGGHVPTEFLFHVWVLQFDADDFLRVFEDGTMDLSDGGGAQRVWINGGKDFGPRPSQFIRDGVVDKGEWTRWYRVL